ncbi:hypothetical protein Q5P01_010637 [Channa striata]|uniref:Ig-like domain-containing protein n=1 Tax=Channa striata TaxID=64152 RepID=A0AA88MVF4_CHASR|nr:hypothetical protein Q5P01_010637 [Channa striata]
MLFLIMSLLHWTQTEGRCSAAVSITGQDRQLSVGEGFKLSCEFTCLGGQHVAQLWRNSRSGDGVSLVNVSSVLPNVSLVLNICSATKADSGDYQCRTQPPNTISPLLSIQIADDLTTRKSSRPTNSSQQPNSAGCECTQPCDPTSQNGLRGQIWYWMLLGKTAVLLLSSAFLAVKYKRA